MSKRKIVPYGRIKTPTGEVEIRNKRVASTLEQLQQNMTAMRDGWQRESHAHEATRSQLRESNERLSRLQNRVWVRIGEALGFIRP